MSDRMTRLQEMLAKSPDDPFLLYGVGMEHRGHARHAEAIAWFDKTLAVDPLYCYAYFQKGQALEDAGQSDAARQAYRAGIRAAREKGDAHAEAEISGALEILGGGE